MLRPTLRQCAVLAGGLGGRLGPLAGTPPFLAWLLRDIARYGVEEILILADDATPAIKGRLDDLAATMPRPMRLRVSAAPAASGTGGAVWHARAALDERFLLVNGSSLFDANLSRLLADAATDGPEVLARLALRRPATDAIDAGVRVLRADIIDRLTPVCSLEHDVLPSLAARGKSRTTELSGRFIDIAAHSEREIDRAERELPTRLRRPALFLDRDGVINLDHGYVGDIGRFEWTPTARAAIRAASDAGWHVFVVTNQSGVARGLYDEDAVRHLHRWMIDEARRQGGTIDDVRYCPFHPEGSVAAYRRESDWRKPAPGMLLDLIRAWDLDPAACVLIGDQPTDLRAAAAAGIAARLFEGGDLAALVTSILRARAGAAVVADAG
jgi:D-glycero-D-manno-heptose 1,7-bisphosphate phosphatase